MRAKVALVRVGSLEFEGLLAEDNKFYVAVVQTTSIFQFDKRQASRGIKSILGEDFQFDKIATEMNPKKINAISLVQFEKLLFELALKGNPSAIALSRDLIGLSLHQLFCDSFLIKFEAEDRLNWLTQRNQGKFTRNVWTDAIQEFCLKNEVSEEYKNTIYARCSDKVNIAFLGMTAKAYREENNIPKGALLRDYLGVNLLEDVEYCEKTAAKLVARKGQDPLTALDSALELYV